ncbi:MAG TPA: isoprenylcysteine carboxylmethyltransferase family protein [Anaerolineales bacterium]|jgi:protein-S-isoprenylcysteine O-methyltransferase Ste14|nr:isoprenylcysteine carboxylmethyltransferase family protein [Anaerolineales bacterium]HQX14913.1 isoprenylcysteine carboxylmethyltransferase family protein [Anaerolineales bacterium]
MSEHKDHASVKIHPPVLLVIHIGVAWLLGRFIILPIVVSPLIRNIGLGLAGIGFLLGLLSLYAFTKARTTVNPHGSVRSIVSTGIYRFTRNPIYLGMVFMLIGFPLAFGNVWGIPLVLIFIPLMNKLVIEHEEAYLEKKFGEGYAGYKSRVKMPLLQKSRRATDSHRITRWRSRARPVAPARNPPMTG